jgi:hypothetical protein
MSYTIPPIATRDEILMQYQQQIFISKSKKQLLREKRLIFAHNIIKKANYKLFDEEFIKFQLNINNLNEHLIIRVQSILLAELNNLISTDDSIYWNNILIGITYQLIEKDLAKEIEINLLDQSITYV